MSTVAEIVAAAANLDEKQFSVLRLELDRIERERWDRESAATSAEFERAGITDEEIDRLVMERRRRESRP